MGSQQPPEHLSLWTELEEGVGYCGCTLLIGRMEREELRVDWEPETHTHTRSPPGGLRVTLRVTRRSSLLHAAQFHIASLVIPSLKVPHTHSLASCHFFAVVQLQPAWSPFLRATGIDIPLVTKGPAPSSGLGSSLSGELVRTLPISLVSLYTRDMQTEDFKLKASLD